METTTATAASIIAIATNTGRDIESVTAELIANMISERPTLALKLAREAGLV